MSKNKEKKFVEIEDPLAGLGFDAEEAEEVVEEDVVVEDIFDEVEEDVTEEAPTVPFSEKLNEIKAKVSETMKPVIDVAAKKMPIKNAAIILGSVVAAAIVIAILIFCLYSGATYTSGRSVDEWAEDWNEISFSDSCTYTFYSAYELTADMEAMLISDTDHVYLTDDDVKALKKGKTVKLFDDIAELSVDTYKGDFHSATLTFDYHELFGKYYGRYYVGDSYMYSPGFFEDSTMRVLGYMSMLMNPLNDTLNTEGECLTAATDLFVVSGNAYNDADGNYILVSDDYTYVLSYATEPRTVTVSATDVSATDVSGTDATTDVTEDHLIITITAKHTLSGQKKHAADWSWWSELFPEKEEGADNISTGLSEQEYDSAVSASDADVLSETDISGTDA